MVIEQNIVQLKKLNVDTLTLLGNFLVNCTPEVYTAFSSNGKASIGQHVRHTIEFYQCLRAASSIVNYDLRQRDAKMETDVDHATDKLNEVQHWLHTLEQDRELLLETSSLGAMSESVKVKSTFARELYHVLDHAVHHMAIIRLLIKEIAPDFLLEERFGVAYSTLSYRGQLAES